MKKFMMTLAAAVCAAASAMAAGNVGIVIGYNDVNSIDNFQEAAAASWFTGTYPDGVVITPGHADLLDPTKVAAVWIHIDRLGIGIGNLPAEFSDAAFIKALTDYVDKGGCLLLTKQATQILTRIGRIDAKFAPGIYGDGEGGPGTDVWTIQAQVGELFNRPEAPEYDPTQYYDHRGHDIYKDLRVDATSFGWETYPMEGTGNGTEMWREDHNCMWDLNAYASIYTSEGKNVVEKFENDNHAVVLGQWGHVIDHAVAGIIEFLPEETSPTTTSGTIIANGLAACEWSPRQGGNAYHANLEALTGNCINYLQARNASGVENVEAADSDAEAVYYNLQGVRVDAPQAAGIYIECRGTQARKIVVK